MSEKLNLKTPVTYYGGKQNLVNTILPLIPKHSLYCEPFAGGAAIFWAKQTSEVEVLNDTNRELMNFYRVVQTDFINLEREVMITLHSRDLFRKASVIYNNPDMFTELLELLSSIKGKFLLSSYPSPVLAEFTKRHGWHTQTKVSKVSVAAKDGNQKSKTEVLTSNYPI